VLVLAALILDGGHVFCLCAAGAIASWVCNLVILLRRPQHPTNFDRALVKYGFWPATMLVSVLAPLLGRAL
jgi:hypothetical protein